MTAFSNVMQCSSPKLLSVKQIFLDTPVNFFYLVYVHLPAHMSVRWKACEPVSFASES